MRRESDIVPLDKRTPGVPTIEPLIFPVLDALYARREKRLNECATTEGEDEGAYFRFLSGLVGTQRNILANNPVSEQDAVAICKMMESGYDHPELESRLREIAGWQNAYDALVQAGAADLPEAACAALKNAGQDRESLSIQAAHLLRGDYGQVDAGVAVVLWAALSLCWAQAVASSQSETGRQTGAQATLCPCCGAPPVASLVLGGDREGLRYLQCSLCETRWHRVRGVCVECGASGRLEHWSLDDVKAPIQIETCGDCKTYIKVFRLDYDPHLEAAADDLGSLTLDAALEQEGFTRIALNPFSFPA
ncbi:formate dehydrogenase accessory protein FdhE [Acetobacter conturbans]|uniref:Formate dehydrogenase accessory protein FdhE n=1 Tax=Acetobacter conturbans TaxID=1737472 RepID=A0ABX0JYH0_9PROT|nr:formate dehydrogenase accessory protein FdhE [Acetobacter conturbans]NHN87927.1 formate dehydrogenase accessory protein FdhE [Acetobacter conturbans]